MKSPSLAVVITSVQPPTSSVRALCNRLEDSESSVIVVGDRKGPAEYPLPRADFLSLRDQERLPFAIVPLLPTGHYVRKNVGYLVAFSRLANCIYETDDDNAPNETWHVRSGTSMCQPAAPRPWANVYRFFSDDLIWPRGFPLSLVREPETFCHDAGGPLREIECPIQQGLADIAPDVDAVWRLLLDRDYRFTGYRSIWLPPGTWCPFNSQSTWWWPVAYPLMYLPANCSFRMTDIWRSFIAQRCLWELGFGLAFHAPEVIQERNPHSLIQDFEQEIPGYLQNEYLVSVLQSTKLQPGSQEVSANLRRCYERLVETGFFPAEELSLVNAWLADIEAIRRSAAGYSA